MPKLRRTRSLVVPPLRLPMTITSSRAQPRHAAGHGLVVAKGAIPVNLAEIGKDPLDQLHGVGALGMPRPLDSVPRRRDGLLLGNDLCFLFAHRYPVPRGQTRRPLRPFYGVRRAWNKCA